MSQNIASENYFFDCHNSRIYSVKQEFVLVLLYFSGALLHTPQEKKKKFYNFALHVIHYADTNLYFCQIANDNKLYLFISFSI